MSAPVVISGVSGISYAGGGVSTSKYIGVPSNISNDLLVTIINSIDAGGDATLISGAGWTKFLDITYPFSGDSTYSSRLFWKTSNGSEPTGYPITGNSFSTYRAETMSVRGAASPTQRAIVTGYDVDFTVNTSNISPSINVVYNESLVVRSVMGRQGGGTYTPPSGYTEIYDNNSTWGYSTLAVKEVNAGATGPETFINSVGWPTSFVLPVFALAPTASDSGSGSPSGSQALGSLIHILFPGRQWLVEPGTTGTSSRYSLVGLYSEGNSTGSSTGGSSGTLQYITGISSIATSLAGAANIIMNMAGISSTYTSSSGTSTVSTANSQFPVGWSNYWQLTATAPTGTVTGFPAFLNLGLLTGLNSIARSDGGDIRVSDTGNNQLACDLLPWYSSGNGGLIINLGTVTGTKTIRVWAGNASETLPAATGTYGQYATYHTGIRGYYPSGAGQDRTSYQNHFAMTGHAGNIGALTNGPISGTKATSFDGASQGIATGTIPTGTPYVLMASHNIRTAGDHAVVLVYSSSVVNKWYELNFVSPSIRAGIFDAGVGGYIAATATNAGLTGTWQNSAAIYPTTGDRSIYVTGLLGQQTFPGVNPGSMNRLAVGYRQAFGRTSGTQSMVVFMTQAVPPALVEYHNRMLANNSQSGFWSSFETSGSFPGSVTGTGLSAVFGNGQYIANNNGSFGGPLYQNIMTFDAGLRTGYSTYRDSIPFSRISGDYGRRFKTEKLAIVPTGVNYPIYLVNSTGGPQNISLASEKNVILVKPNGYNIVVPGTFITDGSDGGLYIMTTGLDMNGKWLFYLQLDGVQSDRYRFEIRGI